MPSDSRPSKQDSESFVDATAAIELDAGPAVVLGIETSCDETAAAVVRDGREIISSVVSSQVELHAEYGGVVPEIAGRAHLELLTPVIDTALRQAAAEGSNTRKSPELKPPVDAVAATIGPGLIGSLLVGVAEAKALSLAWERAVRRGQPPRGAPVRRAARPSEDSTGRSSSSSSRVVTR